MAVVKMTASKATPRELIKYITRDDKAALVSSRNLDPNQDFATQMSETAKMWGKAQSVNSRKYYHLVLSFAPEDWEKNGGTLTEEDALDIGMGLIEEFWPTSESVGGAHKDKDHLHFHGCINSVDLETGMMINMRDDDYCKLKDRVQEICEERGLNAIDWREAVAEKRAAKRAGDLDVKEWEILTFAERGIREREGRPRKPHVLKEGETSNYGWKDELRVIIAYATQNSCSMDEFNSILAYYGVETPRNTENTISYLHPGRQKAVRGDTLGKMYTAATIHDVIAHNANIRAIEIEEEKKHPTLDDLIRRKREEEERQRREREYWKKYREISNASWENYIYGQRREFDAIGLATAAPREIYNSLCRTVIDDDGSVITIPPTSDQLRRAGYYEARDRANEQAAPHREKLKEIQKYEQISKERQKIMKALIEAGAEDEVIQAAIRNFEEAEQEMRAFVNNPDRDPGGRRMRAAMWSLEQAQKRTEKYIAKLQEVEIEETELMQIAEAEYEEFVRTGELQTEHDVDAALEESEKAGNAAWSDPAER